MLALVVEIPPAVMLAPPINAQGEDVECPARITPEIVPGELAGNPWLCQAMVNWLALSVLY